MRNAQRRVKMACVPIQPPTSLPNELRSCLRDICLCFTWFDVPRVRESLSQNLKQNSIAKYIDPAHSREYPFAVGLRHQLEAQDTILGQEHILRENAHTVYTLLP